MQTDCAARGLSALGAGGHIVHEWGCPRWGITLTPIVTVFCRDDFPLSLAGEGRRCTATAGSIEVVRATWWLSALGAGAFPELVEGFMSAVGDRVRGIESAGRVVTSL